MGDIGSADDDELMKYLLAFSVLRRTKVLRLKDGIGGRLPQWNSCLFLAESY